MLSKGAKLILLSGQFLFKQIFVISPVDKKNGKLKIILRMTPNQASATINERQSFQAEEILRLEGLGKKYGRILAVDNLDLRILKGQVYGLLGLNGSGKTTTLGMILGILQPSRGKYYWFGEPARPTTYKRIGSLLERPSFYPYLSATNNLEIVALTRGVNKIEVEPALQMVDLYKRRNHKVQTFSYGMKQRLALASALLGNPEVLILDEPTNGLDPEGIFEIRNIITGIASKGTTVLMASHLLDEVQKTCTHVAILQKGKKKYSGAVGDLLNGGETLELSANDMQTLERLVMTLPEYSSHKVSNHLLELKMNVKIDAAEVNRFLHQHGLSCSYINIHKQSLEQNFLEILQQSTE